MGHRSSSRSRAAAESGSDAKPSTIVSKTPPTAESPAVASEVPKARRASLDWTKVLLGASLVVCVGVLWYSVYTTNKRALDASRLAQRKQSTLAALNEVAGRRFDMVSSGGFEGTRKEDLAKVAM